MSDTRILQKANGAVGRYNYGAFKFNASCDEHARRMVVAHLEQEVKKDQPFQHDPLTPRMRLKLGPEEAERQARDLCPVYKAKAEAGKRLEANNATATKKKGKKR